MAFIAANLVLVAEVVSEIHEATSVDDGFGGTASLTARKRRIWMYSSDADALTDMDATSPAYFAAAGSTSGTGVLNEGDFIFLVGTDQGGIGYVADAAAGSIFAIRGSASGATSQVFA